MKSLGIDSSTQGVKAVVYDADAGKVVASANVNYGRDLPEFGSPEGFLPDADLRIRRATPEMWVRGLELVLERLRESGAPMDEVSAVGGCAQQHATVFLSETGVAGLNGGEAGTAWFSRKASPIWMDSSTGDAEAPTA